MKNDGVLVRKKKRGENFVRGGEKEPKRKSITPCFKSAHQVFDEITQRAPTFCKERALALEIGRAHV